MLSLSRKHSIADDVKVRGVLIEMKRIDPWNSIDPGMVDKLVWKV